MWIVLTLVEIILLLQSLDGLEPAASRENLYHVSMMSLWLLFLPSRVTFVTEREFSLRHLCPC